MQSHEHNGVHFVVEATETKPNQWTWWYRIEDGRTGKISDRPLPTEDLALSEGKGQGEFVIDRK